MPGFMDFFESGEKARREAEQLQRARELAAEQARLNSLYGDYADAVSKAEGRLSRLNKAVEDGTYVRQARQLEQITRQYERMRREAEMVAKYGETAGRFLSRHGGALSLAGGGLAAASGAGLGLARRGFQGTVEGNRFDLEMKMISRELAGAFKPLMDLATRAAGFARRRLERLDEGGQNLVAGGLIAGGALTGGGVAGHFLSKFLTGRGLGEQLTRMAGRNPMGSRDMARLGEHSAAEVAKRPGFLRRAARLGGRTLRAVPYLGTAATVLDASTGGDYGRMREAGKSRTASMMVAIGASMGDMYYSLAPWEKTNPLDEARANWDRKHGRAPAGAPTPAAGAAPGPNPNRRVVTVAGGGFDEPGAAYDRLNAAISLAESPAGAANGDAVQVILDLFRPAVERYMGERGRSGAGLERPGGGS